jgi:hypothetical protein
MSAVINRHAANQTFYRTDNSTIKQPPGRQDQGFWVFISAGVFRKQLKMATF